MNKRDRITAALRREQPDRTPLYDLVDHRGLLSHFAGEELTLENAATVAPRGTGKALDTTRVWLPAPPGRRVDERGFTYKRVDWWNEWKIKAPYEDEAGIEVFIKADIDRFNGMVPPDPTQELEELRSWQARYGDCVLPASLAGEALQDAHITLGIDRYVYFEQDHPDLIREWIASIHRYTLRRLQAQGSRADFSPLAWVFADIAFKKHLMFSKTYLREAGFFRRLAEIFDVYHSQGLLVIFHSDGDISSIVPELIAAGADAIAPVDIPAGMDIIQLKEAYGDRLSFVGGFDLGLLSHGTPGQVREEAQRLIRQVGKGGGLILGSSSEELYEILPEQNILALWETTWETS